MAEVEQSQAPWTVQRMLAWMTRDFAEHGASSPRLDAELLLAHALGCDRVRLYMDMPRPLEARELGEIRALVQRRRKREPVAYIVGRREFYLRSFEVNADVLVPRPETELLVDRALERLPEGEARVLDLCAGSGVIGITLACERPALRVDATDLSDRALVVARRNAQALGVAERVAFHHGDLLAPLDPEARYELVTANPPYVGEGELANLAPEVRVHEPALALVAGEDGLSVLRRLCAEVPDRLCAGGWLLFEVGAGQADRVCAMLDATGALEEVCAHPDLAGIARVVAARKR